MVELSIVLVILGLLAGGILAGKSLIRASEVRSVITEYTRFVTASRAFRDKYFYLPGDLPNATQFWGIAAGTTGLTTACYQTPQGGATATCNGDGDGVISMGSSSYEGWLFWKHLANAGLVEGGFSGTAAGNGGYAGLAPYLTGQKPGWNVPYARLPSAIWDVQNHGTWNASIQKGYGAYVASSALPYYSNALYLLPATGIDVWTGGSLGTDEAWNLDTKLDDGRPGSGKIEAFRGGSQTDSGPCLTSADPALAAYKLTDNASNLCSMVFVGAFR